MLFSLHRVSEQGSEVTEITLDPAVLKEPVFSRCLHFLYTGSVELSKASEHLPDTIAAARTLNLPELEVICENAQKEEEFLNPSIGTWLNDRNSSVAKELFLNRETFSDVSFRVEDSVVWAHKVVLCLRCEVMAAMLSGGFRESEGREVGEGRGGEGRGGEGRGGEWRREGKGDSSFTIELQVCMHVCVQARVL